jgi:membrane protease YdiL (CAAX protease family)
MINILVVAIYFLVSWFTPWEKIEIIKGFSSSYLWDFCYALFIILIFNLKIIEIKKTYFPTLLRLLFIIILGLLSVQLLVTFHIRTPFQYIEYPFIQLLIMAPIFEELVFRGAIQEKLKGQISTKWKLYLISAVLFSCSHLSALFFLPPNFHAFIYGQVAYTFILGWILAKSHEEGFKTLEPILLHFVFNMFFLP